MSLEKDAIQHIEQQAIDADGRRQAALPENTIALPSDYKVHDLQQYEAFRRRFAGTFSTSSVLDFVDYVQANTSEGGRKVDGFIDPNALKCTVFFNLGDAADPGHADWRAQLALQATPLFASLLSVNGAGMDQRALTDWLEDWQNNVTPFLSLSNDVPYGNLAKAITAIREITIKQAAESTNKVGDFDASRTAMEQIEAKSRGELPAGFVVSCEPYAGLPVRQFIVRMSVRTGGDKPVLVLRVLQLEVEREAIAQDFKALLRSKLANHADLVLGTFTP